MSREEPNLTMVAPYTPHHTIQQPYFGPGQPPTPLEPAMLPAPVAPLLDASYLNLEAFEDEVKDENAAEAAAAAAAEPPLSRQAEEELKEAVLEVEENPDLLPGYQSTPLFAPHELRNEYDYDVATGAIISEEGPSEERPVSPLELFFDLFFAALLSKLGHTLSEHLGTHPGHVLFYYVIVFQLTYQNWLQVTSFVNRFASESTSDKLFVGWNLVGLGGVSINVSRCMGSPHVHDCSALVGWMAFGRGAVCLWFLLTMWQIRKRRDGKGYRFSTISFATNLLSVSLMSISAILYKYRSYGGVEDGGPLRPGEDEPGGSPFPSLALGFLVGTMVLDVVNIPVLWFCLPFYRRSYVPINSNLAAERFGLIYIVSLGELVLSSVSMNLHICEGWPQVWRTTTIMLLGVLTGLFFQSSFFELFDLQADHAKKHALEVSILRSWAILHVTSFLALLASLVAAIFARLSLEVLVPVDRLTLCVALVLKILLFSGSNLLYLRHVRVAHGWAADLAAASLLLILGTVVPELVTIGDVTFVGLAVAVWGMLIVLRGMVLPMKLTAEGVEEVQALHARQQRDRKRRGRIFQGLPFMSPARRRGGGVYQRGGGSLNGDRAGIVSFSGDFGGGGGVGEWGGETRSLGEEASSPEERWPLSSSAPQS